jgi:type I restriction enzyme S subunit
MSKIKLGVITKIRTGKLDANASSENGKYPFFTCSKDTLRIDSYSYDCECVLVAGNGDLNVKYYKGKFDAYQRTYIIEDNSSGRLYMPYLYYYLDLYVEELRKQSIGGVIKYIKLGNLTDAVINLPPIETQKETIKILDKSRKLIENKKMQLQEYDLLIKSRFVEMFGDIFNGKSNYPTIKISEVVAPKIERAAKDFNIEDEIKYVDISSVDNKKNIIIGYTEYIMKDAPLRAQQHVRKDDIIISTVRPNLNNVAKVQHDYSNIVASSGFCVLRASKVKSNYLFALVSMQLFADYLASLTTGANYPAVSDKDILNFEIPNAPIEEQIKFSDLIKQVDKLKFAVQQSLNETQTLFDSLMQRYFG